MTIPDTAPLIAILNTSEEITRLLADVFQGEGFRTEVAYVLDIKRGEVDITDFLERHRPAVVVYDIAIPYDENWDVLQRIQQSEAGRRCRYVLTTTNKHALERIVGPTPAHEIVGKPYDLDELIDAVRRALGGGEGTTF